MCRISDDNWLLQSRTYIAQEATAWNAEERHEQEHQQQWESSQQQKHAEAQLSEQIADLQELRIPGVQSQPQLFNSILFGGSSSTSEEEQPEPLQSRTKRVFPGGENGAASSSPARRQRVDAETQTEPQPEPAAQPAVPPVAALCPACQYNFVHFGQGC